MWKEKRPKNEKMSRCSEILRLAVDFRSSTNHCSALTKGLTTDTIRDGGIIPLYTVYTCYTTLVPPLTLFTLFQQFEEKKGSYTWTYDMAI